MAIPTYDNIKLPLLKLAATTKEMGANEAHELLAKEFGLTEKDRSELLESGRQTVFANRIGWARTYLKKAGLLESQRRGYFSITERGREALTANPTSIDNDFLCRYPEFREFYRPNKVDSRLASKGSGADDQHTPVDAIESGFRALKVALVDDLLKTIMSTSPSFFEKLVVDLLLKMGYGGSRQDAGEIVGKSGDGGIDGIIKEDKLGLDVIYVQAKRWDGTVGRPEIQKFAGSLEGARARKGIFITTSRFSDDAREYVGKIDKKIILIDGELLAALLIENDVAVSRVATYEIKKVDSDYFLDE